MLYRLMKSIPVVVLARRVDIYVKIYPDKRYAYIRNYDINFSHLILRDDRYIEYIFQLYLEFLLLSWNAALISKSDMIY